LNDTFRVLLIEDDPMVQEVNRQFIEKVSGFKVVAMAGNGEEGLKLIKKTKPDLVILDVFMPKKDGVEVIKQLRKEDELIDVIFITAANDNETIRSILQNGAIDYIIKPFKFDRIKYALEKYKKRYNQLQLNEELNQQTIDDFLHEQKEWKNDSPQPIELPKGLNERTLEQVLMHLKEQSSAMSAEDVAAGIGIARVTARRYLEYLKDVGEIDLDIQYGGVGRPVNRYILRKV
jgi:two-component system response regulator DctR